MRRREYYWSLYHKTERNQLDDLRTDQVEAIYAALPKAHRKEWLIWRESFQGWKAFEDFPEYIKALRNMKDPTAAPKPPQVNSDERTDRTRVSTSLSPSSKDRTVVAKFSAEDEVVNLSLQEDGLDTRDHMRFDKKFDIRLSYGKKFFASQTVDISLKGMLIKDPLPSGLPPFFSIEIKTSQGVVPVICSVVTPSPGASMTRLRIEVNEFVHLLQAALFVGS